VKLRNGFVSNSSSSSYIIGVGKLVNEELFIKYCNENHIGYDIMTTKEIMEFKTKWSCIKRVLKDKTYFVKDAFDGNEVSVEINPELNEKFVSVYYCEDIEENEDGETDYDITSNDFGQHGKAIFNIADKQLVENWDCTYGAGRNG
jgi:hypothetical protein